MRTKAIVSDLDARRGIPSYLWRFGQERRLALIARFAPLEGESILDIGCGVGTYLHRFRSYSPAVFGVDVEADRLAEGLESGLTNLACAHAEALPFSPSSFGIVLLHEVLEHVDDDRCALFEAYRVTKPGGRIVVFAPNRLFPLETHGIYWGGKYRFGNFPMVNYLPDPLRRRIAPHVRAYTVNDLRRLIDGMQIRIVIHSQIFPGYDRIASRRPWLAAGLRRLTYILERTPLHIFGLSHFLVVEKVGN